MKWESIVTGILFLVCIVALLRAFQTELAFRFCVRIAWILIPNDWAFFLSDSFERSVYESIRSAECDLDSLLKRREAERVENLKNKGTR